MKNKKGITEQQENDLGRYLGCECEYKFKDDILDDKILTTMLLHRLSMDDNNISEFKLYANPVASLTQKDFERMQKKIWKGLRYPAGSEFLKVAYKDTKEGNIEWQEADWLRNHRYYLDEESIREFIKTKKS